MAVAGRWRRPSPLLDALITAAERQVRHATPLDALAAGADPLAVLAALLKAPAPPDTGDRMSGQVRRLASPSRQAEARSGARAAADATNRVRATFDPPVRVAARGAATDGPGTSAAVAGRVTSVTEPAGKPADRLELARSRTALRRSISALADVTGAPEPTRREGAAPSDRMPPHGPARETAATHGLVAAATAAAAARRAIAELGAEATGRVVDLGRGAPDAGGGVPPLLSASLSTATTAFEDRASAPPPRPADPQAQAAPSPSHAPVPAPRRSAAMRGLDDVADALAEAAWRNGVALS